MPYEAEKKGQEHLKESALMVRVKALLSDYHLSPIGQSLVVAWLKEAFSKEGGEMERVKHWMVMKLNGPRKEYESIRATAPAWQVGCPEVLPLLRAMPVWTHALAETAHWIHTIEENAGVIREELLGLRGKKGFQQYRAPAWATSSSSSSSSEGQPPAPPAAQEEEEGGRAGVVSHDAGDWNVFYLHLHNLDFSQNRSLCPRTCELLERCVPRHYHHAFFSALAPGTHVTKHHGPTNKKLRCQLPLVVPEGGCCQLRVADDIITLEEGKVVVFDDSFEHEAWNRHDSMSRLVLVFDLWHPDLSDKEVKFFSLLQRASMRAEKRMGERLRQQQQEEEQGGERAEALEEDADFYELIKKGREAGAVEGNVWRGIE